MLRDWSRKWHKVNEGVMRMGVPTLKKFPDKPTHDQMFAWVLKNIWYQRDTLDTWQDPSQTLARGQGDCEDIAILTMYLLRHLEIDPNPVLLIVELPSRQLHAVCYSPAGGVCYDIQSVNARHIYDPDDAVWKPLAQAWLQGVLVEFNGRLGEP